MTVESIFSFLPSYLSIISLAKGKISKSVSFFFSHIGPKRCWPIRFQDFISNISLEQSDYIVYFFTCWYWKLRFDRKILWWLQPPRWINELSWFYACSYMVSEKLKVILGAHMVKYDFEHLGPGTLKSAMP